jgi:CubicO group peptidase (beta-lactamase class C family)
MIGRMLKRRSQRSRASWLTCGPIVMCLIETASAQSNAPDAKLVAAIDKAVERQGITADEPGVAVMIIQPGKLMFQKGYGRAVLKGPPITSKTMFELASVSKTFTATGILILHDRQKLSIEDDIRKHLSELPVYKSGHPILIRDLLQHTSGLPDYMTFEDVPRKHRTHWTNADYLGEFARQQKSYPLDFPTGEKYEYNNTNFMLLASLIERVDGRTFGTFLKDEIFKPAGMTQTFVYENPATVPKSAGDHVQAVAYERRKKKEVWEPSWGTPPARHEELLTVGDGAVWTNLEDMAAWDRAIRGEKLIKPETWNLALTPSKTRDGMTNAYGLGWALYFEKPKSIYGYGHDGSWGGFQTTYYRYLAADRTTVLLSNRGTMDTDKLWMALDKIVEKQSGGSSE